MVALKASILVVEDEPTQREILRYNLVSAGYEPILASTGDEGLLMIEECSPDLVLLDWMLPEVSGIEICRRIKANKKTKSIPVIMLSARSEEADRVRGLETGADDYVVKPFSMSEVMARIRTQLRRTRPTVTEGQLTYDDIIVDTETHRVTRDGQALALGPTEFRLLATLIENPGKVWSREQLLDRVWGQDIYVGSRTVDVQVGRLRKALMAHGGEDVLRTVRGAGYGLR